jgi:general secretion pathway protein M
MIQELLQRWAALTPRERLVITIGAAVIGAALVFVGVVDPLLERKQLLERQAVRTQRAIREAATLGAEYAKLRKRLSTLESRLPPPEAQFSLVAFVEGAAERARVRERIVGMQPQPPTVVQPYQETSVDVRVDGLSLPELLGLLVELGQASYDVQVRYLQIKSRYDAPHLLDANLRVVSHNRAQ